MPRHFLGTDNETPTKNGLCPGVSESSKYGATGYALDRTSDVQENRKKKMRSKAPMGQWLVP